MIADDSERDVRRAAVLGHPIAHSRSPLLHRAAYRALGLPWTYDAIDVTSEAIVDFVEGRGPEWVGLSLTMPLKESVLPALTHVSPVVELTRAANTVVFEGDERKGHNTDVSGMVGALAEAGIVGVDVACVLGSGATARSSLVALAELGARQVVVVARDGDSAERMTQLGRTLGLDLTRTPWDRSSEALALSLVVSTVPADVAAAVVADVPASPGALFDVIYDPRPTPLARAWAGGSAVLDGLDLLVHQAVGQIELMTGRSVPVSVLREALDDAP